MSVEIDYPLIVKSPDDEPAEPTTEAAFRRLLASMVDLGAKPDGYVYRGPMGLVADEGTWYEPRPLPGRVARREMGRCFENAYRAANASQARGGDWQYVEGYAIGIAIPVLHAWVWSPTRGMLDPTWPKGGSAYLGLVIPIREVVASLWRRDCWSVLDDWHNHYPLCKRPWAETQAQWRLAA